MTFSVEEEIFPTIQVAEDSVKEVNGTDVVEETKHDAKRKLPEKQAEKKVSLLPFPALLCAVYLFPIGGQIPHLVSFSYLNSISLFCIIIIIIIILVTWSIFIVTLTANMILVLFSSLLFYRLSILF